MDMKQQQMPPQAAASNNPLVAPETDMGTMEQQAQQQIQVPEIDPEEMQIVLFSRVDELSPEEAKALVSVINPQTITVFLKLLPELAPLFQDIMMRSSQQSGI